MTNITERVDISVLDLLLTEKLKAADTQLNSERYLLPAERGNRKLYLAGPWFTPAAEALLDHVMEVIVMAELRELCAYKVFYPRTGTVNMTPEEAFQTNVEHVAACDTLLALVDVKDMGTAWEVGMAYALGKEVILIGYDESSFKSKTNLMLAFCGSCITFDALPTFIRGGFLDCEHYTYDKYDWEGIE